MEGMYIIIGAAVAFFTFGGVVLYLLKRRQRSGYEDEKIEDLDERLRIVVEGREDEGRESAHSSPLESDLAVLDRVEDDDDSSPGGSGLRDLLDYLDDQQPQIESPPSIVIPTSGGPHDRSGSSASPGEGTLLPEEREYLEIQRMEKDAYRTSGRTRVSIASAPEDGALPASGGAPAAGGEEGAPASPDDLAEIEALYTADPSNTTLLDYLALEYHSRGDSEKAARYAGLIVERDRTRADAWRILAESLFALGRSDEARQVLEQMKGLDCLQPEDLEWISTMAGAGRGPAQPVRPGAEGIGGVSCPVEAPDAAGGASGGAGAGSGGAASEDEDERLKRARKVSEVLEEKQIMTMYGGEDEESMEMVRQQLAESPDNPQLIDWYAFLCYSSNDLEQAREWYEKLLKIEPDNANALYYLGNIHVKLIDYKKARSYWDRLLALYPDSPLSRKARRKMEKIRKLAAEILRKKRLSRRESGVAPAERAPGGREWTAPRGAAAPEAAAPPPEEGRDRLMRELNLELGGSGGLATGEPGGAGEEEAASFEVDEAILTQYMEGDGSGAAEIEAKLAEDPDNVQLLDWAAFMNYTNKQWKKALSQYERLNELGGDTPQSRYYMANCLLQLGRYGEAAAIYEEIVSEDEGGKLGRKAADKLARMREKGLL